MKISSFMNYICFDLLISFHASDADETMLSLRKLSLVIIF